MCYDKLLSQVLPAHNFALEIRNITRLQELQCPNALDTRSLTHSNFSVPLKQHCWVQGVLY